MISSSSSPWLQTTNPFSTPTSQPLSPHPTPRQLTFKFPEDFTYHYPFNLPPAGYQACFFIPWDSHPMSAIHTSDSWPSADPFFSSSPSHPSVVGYGPRPPSGDTNWPGLEVWWEVGYSFVCMTDWNKMRAFQGYRPTHVSPTGK